MQFSFKAKFPTWISGQYKVEKGGDHKSKNYKG